MKRSWLTIFLIIITVIMFIPNPYTDNPIAFVFIILSILSWRIDDLIKENPKKK